MRLMIAAAALLAVVPFSYAEDYAGGAIKTTTIDNAMVLTDAAGMTLYTYDKDEASKSNCVDQCATNWPPLKADAAATADGDYTIIDRADGTKQWAYKGKPLYLWMKDTKPGEATGDGMADGAWHTAVE